MFFCFYKFKMYFKKGTPKLHKIASPETPGVTTPCQHRYSHMTGYINVGYSIFRQSRANLCTCINRHSSFRQTGEVRPFTRHLIRWKQWGRGGWSGSMARGQSQEDTVPDTTQLTVLRPDWVSLLCHPNKDYSVSSTTMTSALMLVLIQPWENSGLHVHLLAHLINVPIKVILPSKTTKHIGQSAWKRAF